MNMLPSRKAVSEQDPFAYLAGGGEMGERTRAFDWSKSPVGPVAEWPQGLKTAVSICLGSRYPIVIWWGNPAYTQFYNDAYIPILGVNKHPGWLGRSGRECWSEIWPTMGPMWESVFATGEATWSEDFLYVIDRNIPQEECYFTFSYSPIRDDTGKVGGIFCACSEATGRVIGERRLRTLRELSARTTAEAKSAEDACQSAAHILGGNPKDVPFALLYLLDAEGRMATLAGATGLSRDTSLSLAGVDLRGGDSPWPLGQAAESGKAVEVHDLPDRFGRLPGGAWPEPCKQVIVLPMAKPGQTQLAGFVVAGVSPRRPLDDAYRGFLDLLAAQVATAIASARAYEEEKRRAEALAELDRAKTAFFSNVSHEFRTPLTLMLGPVEDLLSKSHTDLSPATAGQLEVVNRNGLRLLRLVNTLLDFSRIEVGRVRAVYQPTDLAAFTAELAGVFRAAVERAGLRLVVDCPPLPEPVYVDRDMWEKVVLNLLSNAFKFTFEGEIAVCLCRVGEAAELRVRDTGTGIPAEEMPRLFERFHRVQNARGRTHEGSGIGLALVQELVKLHGGAVTAESALGRGTTFTVRVPLGSSHLPPGQIGDSRPLASTALGAGPYLEEALRWLPGKEEVQDREQDELPSRYESLPVSYPETAQGENDRPRVLVADDNADLRQYVVRLLAERYRVEAVPDGEAALSSARERLPDLVLTDVMMPRLDGFGLLRELRGDARTRDVPVIMLSARAGEESRVEGMEAGTDDYLVKPFSARELLARVSAHLQMARLRREASESLRKSEGRFRALVNASSDVVYRMSADWAEMRYLQGREFIADTHEPSRTWLKEYIHPDDQSHVMAVIREAVRTKGVFELEHRVLRVDGTQGWMLSRAVPLLDGDGEVVEWFGAASDVTDRKRAEQELREREGWLGGQKEALQAALDGASLETSLGALVRTAVKHFGQETRAAFYLANPEATALRHVVGMPAAYAEAVDGFKIGPESLAYGLATHTGQPVLTSDVTKEPRWQPWLWLTAQFDYRGCWSFPVHTSAGKFVGTFAVYFQQPRDAMPRDLALAAVLTDTAAIIISRHAEAEMRAQAEKGLREADRKKDEFLATLAHELRNPLAPLRNGLQVMKLARADAGAVEQARAMMERQLGQMVRLIDDLLDVSRISRGKISLQRDRVDLAEVVRQAIETSRPLIDASGHELTVHAPSEAIFVDADATRLAQVFANLLNNAAKYTGPGGQIVLTIARQGSDVVVSVRDTGVGIPAPMLPRVFEMFTQVDRSLEKSQGGLGIGLSLVKGLVEMHGGSVEARSEGRGMGSEFVVRLPVVLSLAGERRLEDVPDEATAPPARHRILVADDNRDSTFSLAMLLKMMGNDVRTAHDGLEALDVGAAFRPDLILLDIGMPRLSGYDTARRIREQPWGKNVVLVALTGWGQEEDKRRSQDAGFNRHLVKPVDPAALEKLLAESPAMAR